MAQQIFQVAIESGEEAFGTDAVHDGRYRLIGDLAGKCLHQTKGELGAWSRPHFIIALEEGTQDVPIGSGAAIELLGGEDELLEGELFDGGIKLGGRLDGA